MMGEHTVFSTAVKDKSITLVFLLIAYFLLLGLSMDTHGWGDDQYFQVLNESGSIFEQVWSRYHQWSGRLGIELLLAYTIAWSFFWKLTIPLSIILIIYCFLKLSKYKISPIYFIVVTVLVNLIPSDITSESFYWVTGFYNYLLPCSLGLFCFYVIHERISNKAVIFLAFVSVFIFSYQEQVVIVFVLASVVSLYRVFALNKLFFVALSLFNAVVLFSAPGNILRYNSSVRLYFSNYSDFGFVEKAYLGMDKMYQAFMMSDNWPLFVFLSLLAFVGYHNNEKGIFEKISLVIVFFYLLIFCLQQQKYAFTDESLMGFKYSGTVTSNSIIGANMYKGYLVFLLVLSAAITLMLGLARKHSTVWPALLSLFFGVLSILMLGFSPTVYASGFRVALIFELSLVLATLYLFKCIVNKPLIVGRYW